MSKKDIHDRLCKAFEYLRNRGVIHTQSDFAKAINVRLGHLNNAINGDEIRLTSGLLKKVADAFPDILNRDYLLDGIGDIAAPDKSMRPHFPATVEAGLLGGDAQAVMDYEVDMEPAIKQFPSYDYMIDVSGESMEPTYYDGDSVACRRLYDRSELMPGKVYVFATTNGAVIKRYISSTRSSVRVDSDNPDYEPYSIDTDSILSIAEVVGSVRSRQPSHDDMREAVLKFALSVLKDSPDAEPGLDDKRIMNIILSRMGDMKQN